MENQRAYQKARDKVNAKIALFFHLATYIIVNILLIIINLRTYPQYLWFKWPLLGWGIGLFFHALGVSVFFYGETAIKIKERLIEKEMKKEAAKKK